MANGIENFGSSNPKSGEFRDGLMGGSQGHKWKRLVVNNENFSNPQLLSDVTLPFILSVIM